MKIIGYFSNAPTWRLVDEKSYKNKFSHADAIAYLEHEITESVDRETSLLLSGNSVGFYSALRFLFPEVNHLSHLYWGHKGSYWRNNETRFVSLFMKKFEILSPECGIYYQAFRNGLMHSHHPKWVKRKNGVGWYISNTAKIDEFGIFVPEFANQIKAAIKKFITELENEKKENRSNRLMKFADALADCGTILRKRDLKLKKFRQ